ncbi:unnamed protein product [Tilletia controversa]|uniref:Cytochrome c oxidase subunit 8, mitochondrial n=2 Tax=Tilletia TaxID=13289 RepID=A0A9N8MGC1_9BASI|nr:unnamed protein product [Tilletia caries]CAD6902574.1 unnamed protein product [Tilletia controversa]CAD6935985.1 unnamed protein product [Tilletia laevis]CAD6899928.1 unnamed protein product [Tilletia caries]CAD6921255.1 unnamed protein product [Tilletia controversa]
MVTALLTRRAFAVAPRHFGARNIHIENTVETVIPFKTGPKYKVPLAIGISSFLITGFSLPFVAAWFQIAKASS